MDSTELKAAYYTKETKNMGEQQREENEAKYLSNYQLYSVFLRASWKDRLLSFNASQHRNHSRPLPSLDLPPALRRVYACVSVCARNYVFLG